MLLFILLTLIALIMIVFTIFVISIGGAVGMILCSDIIVCALILGFLIKKLFFKKKQEAQTESLILIREIYKAYYERKEQGEGPMNSEKSRRWTPMKIGRNPKVRSLRRMEGAQIFLS